MGLKISLDAGTEYLLPFAKKKLRELREGLRKTGDILTKNILGSAGEVIFLQSSMLSAPGITLDTIRISGGSIVWWMGADPTLDNFGSSQISLYPTLTQQLLVDKKGSPTLKKYPQVAASNYWTGMSRRNFSDMLLVYAPGGTTGTSSRTLTVLSDSSKSVGCAFPAGSGITGLSRFGRDGLRLVYGYKLINDPVIFPAPSTPHYPNGTYTSNFAVVVVTMDFSDVSNPRATFQEIYSAPATSVQVVQQGNTNNYPKYNWLNGYFADEKSGAFDRGQSTLVIFGDASTSSSFTSTTDTVPAISPIVELIRLSDGHVLFSKDDYQPMDGLLSTNIRPLKTGDYTNARLLHVMNDEGAEPWIVEMLTVANASPSLSSGQDLFFYRGSTLILSFADRSGNFNITNGDGGKQLSSKDGNTAFFAVTSYDRTDQSHQHPTNTKLVVLEGKSVAAAFDFPGIQAAAQLMAPSGDAAIASRNDDHNHLILLVKENGIWNQYALDYTLFASVPFEHQFILSAKLGGVVGWLARSDDASDGDRQTFLWWFTVTKQLDGSYVLSGNGPFSTTVDAAGDHAFVIESAEAFDRW